MENIERKMVETKELEDKLQMIITQHATMIKNVHSLSTLQQDIAKQIVQQHQDVHNLYIALGLKKELSYYSFDIMNAEEH